MKNSLFILVCILFSDLIGFSQSNTKYAFSSPVEPEKPVFFDGSRQEKDVSKVKMAKLFPGEDLALCLYRLDDLLISYNHLDSLKSFYDKHQAVELWQLTRDRLFWDRQMEISTWSILLTPSQSNDKVRDLTKRYTRPESVLGSELASQLNFCLSYLNIDHTDQLLVNNYLIPKFKVVEEILALNVPARLKAWILANDIYNSCVLGINGFPDQTL